jgi:hypothetical protein
VRVKFTYIGLIVATGCIATGSPPIQEGNCTDVGATNGSVCLAGESCQDFADAGASGTCECADSGNWQCEVTPSTTGH